MTRLDLTLPELAANLALDEALLLAAEAGQGGEVLRFWECPLTAVVLGAGGRINDDVDLEACRRDGVAIARRSSGGGTVLLGPGCLCYSLVLRMDRDAALRQVATAHPFILGVISESLGADKAGYGDLVWDGRKCGGSAQQRKREFLLHHGTILYDFDIDLIQRYLREPPKQPEYRSRRPHAEFVTCLPLGADEIARRLADAWGADTADKWQVPNDFQLAVSERFGNPEWIHRL